METAAGISPETIAPILDAGPAQRTEPDLDFIKTLQGQCGDIYRKCMQCGTCSAACALSPDREPFPRKEVAWAIWGLKERLLADPDVWLCHQCNDCSTRCPRGARPGDVLAAVRRETVIHYSRPRWFSRWINTGRMLGLALAVPMLLLAGVRLVRDRLGETLGFEQFSRDGVVFAYSAHFPQWLLNLFFGGLSLLMVILLVTHLSRFWQAMKTQAVARGEYEPVRSLASAVGAMIRRVSSHDNFHQCTTRHARYAAHYCVFFGFIALTIVTLWVITAPINPLAGDGFVYPFNFWSPWKLLANAGGASLLFGVFQMVLYRVRDREQKIAYNTTFDWVLIWLLFGVIVSGFATELLHYIRMEPHRHFVYFIHLTLVAGFILSLPFTKLAHVAYRATAMVFAEYTGRSSEARRDQRRRTTDSPEAT